MTQSVSMSARPAQAGTVQSTQRAVVIWLWIVAALIFAMVVVGGATRLTESGLSITEWHPISGVIPPLGHDTELETLIDPSLQRFATVWCAAGTTHAVFGIGISALIDAIEGAEIVAM